jgi:hypothetical protein
MKLRPKPVLVCLAVLVVLALAGAFYWTGGMEDLLHPRPDRTELIKEHLQKLLYDPTGLAILSCRQVHARAVVNARESYPGLEVLDCQFRHRDPIGQEHLNTHHFILLDGKIIFSQGLDFRDAHGSGRDAEAFLQGLAQRSQAGLGTGGGARPPAGANMQGGAPKGGKGKDKDDKPPDQPANKGDEQAKPPEGKEKE